MGGGSVRGGGRVGGGVGHTGWSRSDRIKLLCARAVASRNRTYIFVQIRLCRATVHDACA